MSETCIRLLADPVQIRQCRQDVEGRKEAFRKLSSVLSLAGSEVRLKILYLLASEKELCPCDLSDILQMSVPSISQHLRKMKDGGLIQSRRVGQTIFYTLHNRQVKTIRPLLRQIEEEPAKEASVA
jgi:DNA-binding transcriptional ArsR family regulator